MADMEAQDCEKLLKDLNLTHLSEKDWRGKQSIRAFSKTEEGKSFLDNLVMKIQQLLIEAVKEEFSGFTTYHAQKEKLMRIKSYQNVIQLINNLCDTNYETAADVLWEYFNQPVKK